MSNDQYTTYYLKEKVKQTTQARRMAASAAIDTMVRQRMEQTGSKDYSQTMREVCAENPRLRDLYISTGDVK